MKSLDRRARDAHATVASGSSRIFSWSPPRAKNGFGRAEERADPERERARASERAAAPGSIEGHTSSVKKNGARPNGRRQNPLSRISVSESSRSQAEQARSCSQGGPLPIATLMGPPIARIIGPG